MNAQYFRARSVEYAIASVTLEGLQYHLGRWCLALPVFRVQRQARGTSLLHLLPYFSFQQCLHQIHHMIQPEQTFHTTTVLQPQRHHPEDTLQLLVSFLREGLVLVFLQGLFQAQALVVGHQREDPIAAFRLVQRLFVFLDANRVAVARHCRVLRIRPRSTGSHLHRFHMHVLNDLHLQPSAHFRFGQHARDRFLDCFLGGEDAPASGWTQLLQTFAGLVQFLFPCFSVAVLFL